MSEDLLERAARALREQTNEPELRSGLTRARVLDGAKKLQQKRGSRLRFIVPFGLALGAGTALAHVTQQYFPEVWNAVVPAALERPVLEQARAQQPRKSKPHELREHIAAAGAQASTPTPAAPPVITTPTAVPAAETEALVVARESAPAHAFGAAHQGMPRGERRARVARARAVRSVAAAELQPASAPAPAAPAPESAELALFRRAMKLQDAKDRAAIDAWDDFLRVAQGNPLAPEARYNRALALVRAGRVHDARTALIPFARGVFGSYRMREARELLEALDRATPATASER